MYEIFMGQNLRYVALAVSKNFLTAYFMLKETPNLEIFISGPSK